MAVKMGTRADFNGYNLGISDFGIGFNLGKMFCAFIIDWIFKGKLG